jgi:site-specific DNA recombinase
MFDYNIKWHINQVKILTAIVDYDYQLIRRLIEKVIVYEDKFTVKFKSSVKVDLNE